MSNSSSPYGDILNLLFFLVIYVPFNIFVMAVAAVLFSITNRMLHLHFPIWALATAAAVLVFVLMVAVFETSPSDISSGSSTVYYISTFIINTFVVIVMLTLTGITRLIFGNPDTVPFGFQKPQIAAIIVYGLATLFLGLIPIAGDGRAYMDDRQNDEKLEEIKATMDSDKVADFAEMNQDTYELWKLELPGEQKSVLEYLIAGDKTDMVKIILKDRKELFTYSLTWDVKSPAMMQVIVDAGMDPDQLIYELVKFNKADLVKIAVEKYHPKFNSSVSYITERVLEHHNTDLFDYLVQNGLASELSQSSETITRFTEKNDVSSATMLLEKGFKVDTSYNNMIYWAVYHHNLPLLQLLFKYPFNVNAFSDEYTHLENAIIGNSPDIFEFLLTRKPDVKTLHTTKLNGETNALLIAERYDRADMLAKLKQYQRQKDGR